MIQFSMLTEVLPNLRSRSAKYRVLRLRRQAGCRLFVPFWPEDPEGGRAGSGGGGICVHRFEEQFWCEDLSTYALALDGQKRPCRVRTSNAGHCLYTGIASPERARRVAETLFEPESIQRLGRCARSRPAGRVTIHSHITMDRYGRTTTRSLRAGSQNTDTRNSRAGYLWGCSTLSSMVDLHRLPELFCGIDRRAGEGPTLYPVACSPQAWAAAAPF